MKGCFQSPKLPTSTVTCSTHVSSVKSLTHVSSDLFSCQERYVVKSGALRLAGDGERGDAAAAAGQRGAALREPLL
eukprot:4023679-Pleurochrysis_carterae.AAC.1